MFTDPKYFLSVQLSESSTSLQPSLSHYVSMQKKLRWTKATVYNELTLYAIITDVK